MTSQQFPLFDLERPSPTESLRLSSSADRPLTKAQKTFNKLAGKLEGLRRRLVDETKKLDHALAYYGEHLHPRLERHRGLVEELVLTAASFLDDRRLKKSERRALRDVIAGQLDDLTEAGPIEDAKLRAVFEQIHGVDYHDAQKERFDVATEQMQEMLGDLGFDVDLSDLKNFSPDGHGDALAAAAARLTQRLAREAAEAEANQAERRACRPKSKRLREKEQQAETLRKKTLSSLYRDLAKVLHPDLEQDPELRRQKSVIMQELTAAYRANDLHTLLRLELEWIQRETGNLERLTEEKLAIYNSVLREQISGLEIQIRQLPFDPRYEPIVTPDGPFSFRVLTNGPAEARRTEAAIATIERTLMDLRSPTAIDTLRTILREHREMMREAPF